MIVLEGSTSTKVVQGVTIMVGVVAVVEEEDGEEDEVEDTGGRDSVRFSPRLMG